MCGQCERWRVGGLREGLGVDQSKEREYQRQKKL